jgi:hypothetical protein
MNSQSLVGRATTLCILIGSLALSSCNQQNGSEVQTLDNFARTGDLKMNSCSGDFPLSPDFLAVYSKADEKLVEPLAQAVRSVPPRLQNAFFGADSGIIGLTADADKVCRHVLAKQSGEKITAVAEQEAKMRGCFDPDRQAKRLHLYVQADRPSVSHSTVRMFGYALAEFYGPRWFANWNTTILELGTLFLQDIHHSPDLSVKPYAGLLDSESGLHLFATLVFADTFDSYYCNAETRENLAKTFPRTFLGFRQMTNVIETKEVK